MNPVNGLHFSNLRGDIYGGLAAAVVAVPLALLIGALCYLLFMPAGSTPIIGDIPSGFPEFRLPIIEAALLAKMVVSGIMLAGLRSTDSLLSSLVADNVTRTRHKSDRELVGQGIGNTVAGLFGGLPGAGATMRTVVNVKAGGRILLFHMSGPMSFSAAKGVARHHATIQDYDAMLLDLTEVPMVDFTSCRALEDIIVDTQKAGRHVLLVGARERVFSMLKRQKVLHRLDAAHMYSGRLDALQHAMQLINSSPRGG